MSEKYDVIIIGAGIAGLTAAIYSSRQKLSTLVIGKDLGGQLILTPEIQNYPGFTSISGYDLIRKIEIQAKTYGAKIVYDEVVKVWEEGKQFYVKTTTETYQSEALILAFGKTPRDMGIPGEKELKGRGVSYCTICDAALYRGKTTALIGWGSHAVESALLLSDYASKVYWIFPSKTPSRDEEMIEMVRSKGNVVFYPNSKPIEVKGKMKVESLVIEQNGKQIELKVDGVFVEMGYVTKTDFVKDFVKLNEKGEIITNKKAETSREGVFAAGDVTESPFKQAVIAAGQGAVAALAAYEYIMKKRGKKVSILGDWKHITTVREEKPKFEFKL